MSAKLYEVAAPHFNAGFITSDTGLSIAYAAPIIKYFRGKSMVFATDYCQRKGWRLTDLGSNKVEVMEQLRKG